MKNYEESRLQQQCVAWFRAQYPQYSMLLTHPINEGSKNTRVSGAIHKAEGTVAGVADLLFFLPSRITERKGKDGTVVPCIKYFHGLFIELKTETGRQSQEQKDFQKMVEAAGYRYVVLRSYEEFKNIVTLWIEQANEERRKLVSEAHAAIIKANEERELKHFRKVIGKK